MTAKLSFEKYSGAGNDFIMINNYSERYNHSWSDLAVKLCPRGISVGADGLIAIEPSEKADFKMRYFNSDGSEAEMCGNGGRCVSMFAYKQSIAGEIMSFETISGIYTSEITDNEVTLSMPPVESWQKYTIKYNNDLLEGLYLNTGVPHFVLKGTPGNIIEAGRFFRNHGKFSPHGTNVDWYSLRGDDIIEIRTYERGVENETLACGTGSVASAIYAFINGETGNTVRVITRSGVILTVEIVFTGDRMSGLYLSGEARKVFRGTVEV